MDTLLIVLVAGIIWFLYIKNKKKESTPANAEYTTEHKKKLLEDYVINAQNRFENTMNEKRDFPDAISRRDVYLYKQFMSPAYDRLIAKYRYEDEMIQKIRKDWLTYMVELESAWTCAYLSMEFYDDKKTEDYSNSAHTSFLKVKNIENSFAELLGNSQVKKLEDMRKIEFSQLNNLGELINVKNGG